MNERPRSRSKPSSALTRPRLATWMRSSSCSDAPRYLSARDLASGRKRLTSSSLSLGSCVSAYSRSRSFSSARCPSILIALVASTLSVGGRPLRLADSLPALRFVRGPLDMLPFLLLQKYASEALERAGNRAIWAHATRVMWAPRGLTAASSDHGALASSRDLV